MKLLYIDAFAQSANPTTNLMPHLARTAISDCTFYGPGFCSREDLKAGLPHFVASNGPFDVVLVGAVTPLVTDGEAAITGMVNFLHRFTSLASSPDDLAEFFRDLSSTIGSIDIPIKILSLVNFDYYATVPEQLERIKSLGLYILGPNRQFVARMEELPEDAFQERHVQQKWKRLNNSLADYVAENPERVLTAVHFVADTEFFFRHPDGRPKDIGVPGVEYYLRDKAVKALRSARLKVSSKWIYHAYRVLRFLRFPAFTNYLSLRIFQLAFQLGLVDAKTIFTARGGMGIPIRKFFEIPAAGAMMIAVPPLGFEALGFRDGVHYVKCEPDQLVERVSGMLDRPDELARVAAAGRELVFMQHSLTARARQLRACIDALRAGTYRGADWIDGQFVLRSEG